MAERTKDTTIGELKYLFIHNLAEFDKKFFEKKTQINKRYQKNAFQMLMGPEDSKTKEQIDFGDDFTSLGGLKAEKD